MNSVRRSYTLVAGTILQTEEYPVTLAVDTEVFADEADIEAAIRSKATAIGGRLRQHTEGKTVIADAL